MKNGPLFFLGLFAALAASWAGMVLGPHAQIGSLAPYFDETQGQAFPARLSGVAARGQLVYAELGCAACHTQQVRRPDFGSDKARGWGDRQTVARDYIHQARPQLGAMRFGPDLTNFAARKVRNADEAERAKRDLLVFLHNGNASHPSYGFLFEERDVGGQRAANGLSVPDEPRREIVPTNQAESLVAYLLSLNLGVAYPEAQPIEPPKGKAPAPEHRDEKPIPAAAPDLKKQEPKK